MRPVIEQLGAEQGVAEALADLLVDVVAADGSVGFRHPLAPDIALDYWRTALADPGRLVFGARLNGELVGTVTLFLATPDNQPHRAELWKMLVAPRARRQGVADALLKRAESAAVTAGRTLLVLDTVTAGPASRIYERAGWTKVGDIPNYALSPMGEWCGTTLYYRDLRD